MDLWINAPSEYCSIPVIYYYRPRLLWAPKGIAYIYSVDPDWMTQGSGGVIRSY